MGVWALVWEVWAMAWDLAWDLVWDMVAMAWAQAWAWDLDMVWAPALGWALEKEWVPHLAWALVKDPAWEWTWTWTICSGPRGADVTASTRRGTLMMTECTALPDPSTASRCAWRAIMMVRNPSMWMSLALSMNTLAMVLDMAMAWVVQDPAMAWVQDPAMAWVQDPAMAWAVQDPAWVQDLKWNLWLSQMLEQRSYRQKT